MAAITTRLHGLPLAIELAAARTKLLTPDAILARLEHQLDVLSAGARDLPARQQTLRGAIAWSYDLLDEGSRRLLDRLSVFAGRADIEAAEAVTGPASELGIDVVDGLMALADQSMVRVDETADGEPRFALLESIREYAGERLDARGEREAIVARHRDWFVALAERAAKELSGDDQRRWLDRLELAHDDIRVVLDRAVARPDPPVAIGLGFTMWRFWRSTATGRRGAGSIGWPRHLGRARTRARARLVEALGGVCWWQGDVVAMQVTTRRPSRSGGDHDDRELANAYYNASSPMRSARRQDQVGDPEGKGGRTSARRSKPSVGSAIARRANALWGPGPCTTKADFASSEREIAPH